MSVLVYIGQNNNAWHSECINMRQKLKLMHKYCYFELKEILKLYNVLAGLKHSGLK